MSNTVHTTCPYCGVGCGVVINQDNDGQITVAGDKSHPANFGRLCSKGSALAETIDLKGRLLYPELKGEQTDWETALTAVAEGLADIINNHGPDAVAFYVSGQLLTEDYYVANKLMKGFIGSANIDTNSRLCMSSAVAGHKRAFGMDTVANCYEDLEIADLIVLTGSNAAWCHPVLYQRIKAAAEDRDNLKVIVIDPRRTASCDGAFLHLPIRPGTDVVLFNGLLNYLVSGHHHDPDYIASHTEHFDQALNAAQRNAPDVETVAAICDLPVEDVSIFYQTFATTQKTVSLFSQGVNQSSSGTDKVNSIINCHLATGRIGKEGCGAFSITGQPNAMGGREVGGLASMLAAHMDFSVLEVDRVQRFWESPQIADKPGLKAVDLFHAINTGKVKAVWIMATNPVVSMPEADRVKQALKQCDLVIVSDCIKNTDTTDCADILLPATGWGEKSGTVSNSERRISRVRSFMPAPGEARHDWWIISEVAKRMGFEKPFNYASEADIFREHAALSGFENLGERDFDISGLKDLNNQEYDKLMPRQWPVIGNPDNSTKRLLSNGKFFTATGKAQFLPLKYNPPRNSCSKEFPLVLNTGRVRDHWHTLTRTGKAPTLSRHIVEPCASVHPDTAKQFDLHENDLVDVSSKNGSITVRLRISLDQRPGEIFVPMHWNAQFASRARVDSLIFAATDPVSGQPEFKVTPVNIKRHDYRWYGFLMSREILNNPGTEYWVKAIENDFWRYEMADEVVQDNWRTWLDEISGSKLRDRVEYIDQATGVYRSAWFRDGRLHGCLFITPAYDRLPSRDWLLTQFAVEEFDALSRIRLLGGRPADPDADTGPVVCSCFNIGKNTIINAIKDQELETVDSIGACLKAGTNCGSCKPELKALLSESVQTETATICSQ